MLTTEKEKIKDSIAWCGLICHMCFRRHECDGCKTDNNLCERNCSDAGCFQKTCCQERGLEGCWQCDAIKSCTEGIYFQGNKSKIKAFALCIKEDGADRFSENILSCIELGLNVEKGRDFDNRTIENTMALVRKGASLAKADIYVTPTRYEKDGILLRPLQAGDEDGLLACYSDEKAAAFFNSDNCHGDDFRYRTKERMLQAIEFWDFSFRNRYFVRWAVIESGTGSTIGTIEMFRRNHDDEFNNWGILRIDLRSDYEKASNIAKILEIAKDNFFDAFDVENMVTKAIPDAEQRISALKSAGARPLGRPFIAYDDYWLLNSARKQ